MVAAAWRSASTIHTEASGPLRRAWPAHPDRRRTCDHHAVNTPIIPQYHELMWPVLVALKELGGSATIREIYERVVEDEHFREDQQAVPTRDGRMSEIEYRLHWARTHLKASGAVENSARGVWAITDKGRAITPEQMQSETKAWRAEIRAKRSERPIEDATENADTSRAIVVERPAEPPAIGAFAGGF